VSFKQAEVEFQIMLISSYMMTNPHAEICFVISTSIALSQLISSSIRIFVSFHARWSINLLNW